MPGPNGNPTADELYAAGALSSTPLPRGVVPIAAEDADFEGLSLLDHVEEDEDENPKGTPAAISLLPTATTDPKRPRTLAAGYDKKLQTLTVIFRDGTMYNYYDVDNLTWANFKRARSKGRFILAYLDSHDRGFPLPGAVSEYAQNFLSDVASEYQEAQGGLQPGHSATSKRGMRPYRAR
jgi:hypothetical protein